MPFEQRTLSDFNNQEGGNPLFFFMQKKDTLKQIAEDLHRGDVDQALEGWLGSYRAISTAEFLKCNQKWSPEELLLILRDKVKIINYAIDKIQHHVQ